MSAAEFGYQVGVMKQKDGDKAENQAAGQPRFELRGIKTPASVPINRHHTKERDHRRRNPVRKHARVDSEQQVTKKQWAAHAEKINQLWIVPAAAPKRDASPDHRHEKYRVQQAEFTSDKFQEIACGRFPGFVRARVFGEMRKSGPAVLTVPDHYRQGAKCVEQQ